MADRKLNTPNPTEKDLTLEEIYKKHDEEFGWLDSAEHCAEQQESAEEFLQCHPFSNWCHGVRYLILWVCSLGIGAFFFRNHMRHIYQQFITNKKLERQNELLAEQNAALNRIADALEKKPDKKLLLEEKE